MVPPLSAGLIVVSGRVCKDFRADISGCVRFGLVCVGERDIVLRDCQTSEVYCSRLGLSGFGGDQLLFVLNG